MASETATVDTIARIDPTEWDDVSAGRPFTGHRWQRLAESVLRDHEPRYVLLRRDGRLVAAAVCALGRRLQSPTLQRRAGWLLRALPYLRCEIPIAFDSGLLLRPGESVAPLLAAIGRLADRERAAFVRLDSLRPDDDAWAGLAGGGYEPFPMWSETVLDLGWPSLDAYLGSLPSRKRVELGRVRRRADDEGLVVEPHRPSADSAPLLRGLVGQVMARHAATERYHPDLFGRAAAALGDDLRVLVARREGRIVACAALLRDGDEVTAKWLGLDYDRTWNSFCYPRLLFAIVESAIALGARRLRTGATAYQTKRHFGVAIEGRRGAVSARLPCLTRLAARALAGGIETDAA